MSSDWKQKSLTPVLISENDPSYKTVDDLLHALADEQNLNIAVTGPYGSGKSSVLKTLVTKAPENYRFLDISLATLEAEAQLLDGTKSISQIYRNFLLAECYRINEPAHEAYSVVLAPKDHPTTQQEVASLREELKEEYHYKVLDVTLEDFVEQALSVCPEESRKPFRGFKDRYLNFEK